MVMFPPPSMVSAPCPLTIVGKVEPSVIVPLTLKVMVSLSLLPAPQLVFAGALFAARIEGLEDERQRYGAPGGPPANGHTPYGDIPPPAATVGGGSASPKCSMAAPDLPLQPVAATRCIRRHPLRERAAQESSTCWQRRWGR